MTSLTTPGLKGLQQRMAAALMVPLTPSEHIARRAPAVEHAVELIKHNSRLTSTERLEIYSRSYWFRLLGSLSEDFPGLMAVLGPEKFERLAKAYLCDCPSQSFTLRDLGSRLAEWLRLHPEYAGRNRVLALDMARLEWAHIVAFDGPAEDMLGGEILSRPDPGLRLDIQPYVSLLEPGYPVDELRVKVNTSQEGNQVLSNIVRPKKHRLLCQRIVERLARSKPTALFVAVHRMDLNVYYRRLMREEFRLLTALRAGEPIARAIASAFEGSSVEANAIPALLKTWFTAWAEFGWLCERRRVAKRNRTPL
jgi:hypothetical protein